MAEARAKIQVTHEKNPKGQTPNPKEISNGVEELERQIFFGV
jgi:hypothetical protein